MPVKASLMIANDVRSRIAKGELQPGEMLPVESELMTDYGASKGVVREALRILETEGLVQPRRGLGGGPQVRHPTISEAARSIGVYLQIGNVPVEDVWEARDRIVGGAVERLAAASVDDSLDDLAKEIDSLHDLVGQFDAFFPQMLIVDETVVRLAGSATELALAEALRSIIGSELEAATHYSVHLEGGPEAAFDAEHDVADAWMRVLKHVRGGRPRAARAAYEEQSALVRMSPALSRMAREEGPRSAKKPKRAG